MKHDDDRDKLPVVRSLPERLIPQTFAADGEFSSTTVYAKELTSRTAEDYLHAFAQRKWLVVSIAVLGFVLGLATIIPKPLTYSAKTSVEVQGFNESFMNLNQVDPQASAGIYAANSANILTQVEILNSNSLRGRVAERLERETIPSMPPTGSGIAALFNVIRNAVGFAPAHPVESLREAIQTAGSTVRARALEGTRIVEIECQSTAPEIASDFLNNLVTEYIEQSLESRVKTSKRTNLWLASQLEEQKQKLEEVETRLKDFVATAGVQGLTQNGQGGSLADSKLNQLQSELATIQADRIVRQSRYEMVLKNGAESLPDAMTSGTLPQYQSQRSDLQRQIADLTTTYTSKHPKVQRLQAQLSEVEQAIEKEKARVVERMQNDYEAAKRREQLLSGSFSSQTSTVRSQADKTLQYNLLRRDVETSRQIYNSILQQVNQAGIATALPTNNIRVVDSAAPDVRAVMRNLYIGGGLGLMTGLLMGCIMAVMLTQADTRFYKPGEQISILNLPELGVIPSGRILEEKRGFRQFAGLSPFGGRKVLVAHGENGSGDASRPLNMELITYEQRPSIVAESFRSVLMSILFSTDGKRYKVLAVTSPNPQDGKSTVVTNLAITLAEKGKRVLLVDADLRKPKLHTVFQMENTWGLGDILQDQTTVESYPREAFSRETAIPNLSLLTSGPPVKAVTNLIHSERFHELISRLSMEFDNILIDTPPVLLVPDARAIGLWSDGMIVVIRSGQTSRGDALAAVQRLRDDGTTILGTVLNNYLPAGFGKRRYGKYHGYYGQSGD